MSEPHLRFKQNASSFIPQAPEKRPTEVRRTRSGAIIHETHVGDSLINTISGLGTDRDRNAYADFQRNFGFSYDYPQLEALYAENWVAKKIINVVAEDMTREWRTFDADEIPPEDIEKIEEQERQFYLKRLVTKALRWARLYGGSVLFPIFRRESRAAQSLTDPLTLDMIKPGDLEGFNVLEARYVFPAGTTSVNPGSLNYLTPQYYTMTGAESMFIHESRIIRFEGDDLPRRERQQNRYWGQSVLESVRKAVVDAFTSSGVVSSLMHEANIDIIEIEGLANAIMANGEEQIKKRYELYYFLKSMFDVTLIDSKETYGNRQINFSNLDKIMEMFYIITAGAANMPVTKLLGVSPSGLNATGEHDLRNYYDYISIEQEDKLLEPLTYLDMILSQNVWGDQKDLPFSFDSLWQEDPTQKATREHTQAQMDEIYLNLGVITEFQVLQELKERGTYSNITDEDLSRMEQMSKEAEDAFRNGTTTSPTIRQDSNPAAQSPQRDEDGEGDTTEQDD